MASLEVRIRIASEATSRYLMDIDMEDTHDVIPLIKGWGIYGDGVPDDPEMSGQFCLTDQSAYFEVVIGDGD